MLNEGFLNFIRSLCKTGGKRWLNGLKSKNTPTEIIEHKGNDSNTHYKETNMQMRVNTSIFNQYKNVLNGKSIFMYFLKNKIWTLQDH